MSRPAATRRGPLTALVRFGLRRPWLFLASVFVLAWLLAAGERALARLEMERSEPSRGACWIWAQGLAKTGEPATFWAIRDLKLERPQRAHMVIVVDEAYTLWVNGVQVGGGVHRPGAPAHRWDLTDFLDAGWNRLAIEARSSRGAGGILASLRLGEEGRPAFGTGADWTIVKRDHPNITLGLPIPTELRETPAIWGRGETGRWRPKPAEVDRPSVPRPWPPPEILRPRRLRFANEEGEWIEPAIRPKHWPGQQVIYDFGAEVEGMLELRLDEPEIPPEAPAAPALLFFDSEPPRPQDRRPDVVMQPFLVDGWWRDAVPRRFRYLALIGAPTLADIRLIRVKPEITARLAADPEPLVGVFGLPPAKDHLPVEEDVWDRLEAESGGQAEAAPGSDP